jgi:two-component system CheB/CheR fusion protein
MTFAPRVRMFNDPCVSDLTPRQRDILDRVVAGRPNKAIAHELGISQRTVENHRAAVMQTLNARCFADLMRIVLTMPQPSRHAG